MYNLSFKAYFLNLEKTLNIFHEHVSYGLNFVCKINVTTKINKSQLTNQNIEAMIRVIHILIRL